MSTFLTGLFNITTSIIKYSLYTTVIVGTGASIVLYKTKPTNNSFKTYLRNNIVSNSNISDKKSFKYIISIGLDIANSTVIDTKIDDYVLVKHAFIQENEDNGTCEKVHYIGILNNWYQI